jgi:hypothetical protein
MGVNRFFYVESKAFEIVKNKIELSIIERSRNHVSSVTMGFVAALWLRDVLLEVANMSNDQNLFRSFREGNKIFVLQKQRNGKGRFATITTLGDTKSKGYVIIPEGRDSCGWNGVRQEISSIMEDHVHGQREVKTRQSTEQGNQVSNVVRETCTFKDAVMQGDLPTILIGNAGIQGESSHLTAQEKAQVPVGIESAPVWGNGVAMAAAPQTVVSAGVDKGKNPADILGEIPKIAHSSQPLFEKLSSNLDNIDFASSDIDMGLLQFSLQIQIARGLNGVWGVKHVSIDGTHKSPNVNDVKSTTYAVETGPNSTDQRHLGSAKQNRSQARAHRPKRAQKPKRQKWAWRPKPRSHPGLTRPDSATTGPALTPSPHIPESSSLENSKQDPSSSDVVQHMDIIPHPGEVVTRTWGTSSDWVLELRGGRRLSIPVSLLRPQLGEFQVTKPILPTGMGEASGGGEALGLSSEYSGEEGDDEGESVGVDSEFSTGDGVVACWDGEEVPLEVFPLASVVPQEGVSAPELLMMGEAETDLPPSDWVMGKYQHFGDFVGASYEGYEEEVLTLLKSIDARRANFEKGEIVSDINVRSGRKGSRELKGLVSTINYDTGSSRSRSNNRERALMLSNEC